MTTLYLATSDGPIIVTREGQRWRAERPLDAGSASSVAVDRSRPDRLFCGTTRRGVWRSDDAGRTWQPAFKGMPHNRITALAVSGAEREDGFGVVYVGTDPSSVVRSTDGGETWRVCEGLIRLPSSAEWSFPPRPETHHVRWIEPDPHDAGRIHVAIEAGALVHSPDGGATWHDRVPGGPIDTHQLATHPDAPGRLWSAAGDGFFESDDAGGSWRKSEQGLRFRYCWSVAVDPANVQAVVLTAAPGPMQAHRPEQAESAVFRRTGTGPWQEVHAGLPAPEGTRAPIVATNPAEPGVFYLAAEANLYRSSDAGATWQRLDVHWPEDYTGARPHALVAVSQE